MSCVVRRSASACSAGLSRGEICGAAGLGCAGAGCAGFVAGGFAGGGTTSAGGAGFSGGGVLASGAGLEGCGAGSAAGTVPPEGGAACTVRFLQPVAAR